jgi:hypothetical protein
VTAFSGATDYVGGFSLRQEAGGAMDHSYLELSQRPQTNCGGSPIAIELLTGVAVGGSWRDSKTLEITTSGTTGGLGLIAYFEASAPFVVCFDDAYMGIGLDPVLEIFADDLEGGTLDEWSGSAP